MGDSDWGGVFALPLSIAKPGPPLAPGRMTITVVECKDVHKAWGEIGGSDAYVNLEVGNQAHKTSVKSGSAAKVWNETFTFDIDDDDLVMVAGLYDKDTFSADDLLGGYPIPLSDWADMKETTREYPLTLGNPNPDKAAVLVVKGRYVSHERSRTFKVAPLAKITDKAALQDAFPDAKRIHIVEPLQDGDERCAYVEAKTDAVITTLMFRSKLTLDGQDVTLTQPDKSVRDAMAEDEAARAAVEANQRAEAAAAAAAAAAEAKKKQDEIDAQLAAAKDASAEETEKLKAQQAELAAKLEAEEKKRAEVEAASKAAAEAADAKAKALAEKLEALEKERMAAAQRKEPPPSLTAAHKQALKHMKDGKGVFGFFAPGGK